MEPPVTKIQASPRFGLEIKEIIAKHELLFYFMWRNFKIRYKQTVIGAGWAVFKPFILMVVFTLLFNKTINVKTGAGNIPYPIFSYVGLLFWTYFSQTVVQVGTSMVDNQSIFTKIYFPRLIIPLSTTLTGLIDFAAAALIYIVMMLHYGIYPTLSGSLLFIPMLLLSMITVMGMGCYMAALNVR